MVRPKASTYNLAAGAAFAELITKHSTEPPDSFENVDCMGAMSIFGVLKSMLPQLCRDVGDIDTQNRRALTMLELNKFLKRMGWTKSRIYKRFQETSRRPWVSCVANC
jgi:hypothetical protein